MVAWTDSSIVLCGKSPNFIHSFLVSFKKVPIQVSPLYKVNEVLALLITEFLFLKGVLLKNRKPGIDIWTYKEGCLWSLLDEHILVVLLRCNQSEAVELILAHKDNSIDVQLTDGHKLSVSADLRQHVANLCLPVNFERETLLLIFGEPRGLIYVIRYLHKPILIPPLDNVKWHNVHSQTVLKQALILFEFLIDLVLLIEAKLEMRRDLVNRDLFKDVLPVTISDIDQHIGWSIVWPLFFVEKTILILEERLKTTTTNAEGCLLNNGCYDAIVEFEPLLVDWGLNKGEVMAGA